MKYRIRPIYKIQFDDILDDFETQKARKGKVSI